jgi:hypothetical protein
LATRREWRRTQHLAGRQIAAGAGLVVDHDRQAAAPGQLLRQDAGHDVAAARREADQQQELLPAGAASMETTAPGLHPAARQLPRQTGSTIADA